MTFVTAFFWIPASFSAWQKEPECLLHMPFQSETHQRWLTPPSRHEPSKCHDTGMPLRPDSPTIDPHPDHRTAANDLDFYQIQSFIPFSCLSATAKSWGCCTGRCLFVYSYLVLWRLVLRVPEFCWTVPLPPCWKYTGQKENHKSENRKKRADWGYAANWRCCNWFQLSSQSVCVCMCVSDDTVWSVSLSAKQWSLSSSRLCCCLIRFWVGLCLSRWRQNQRGRRPVYGSARDKEGRGRRMMGINRANGNFSRCILVLCNACAKTHQNQWLVKVTQCDCSNILQPPYTCRDPPTKSSPGFFQSSSTFWHKGKCPNSV